MLDVWRHVKRGSLVKPNLADSLEPRIHPPLENIVRSELNHVMMVLANVGNLVLGLVDLGHGPATRGIGDGLAVDAFEDVVHGQLHRTSVGSGYH